MRYLMRRVIDWLAILSLVVATVRPQSSRQVRCHWCSTVPGSVVYSQGCGDKFNASDTRICVGQSCIRAAGITKDTPSLKHIGRACSSRQVTPTDSYPAGDFACRRMSSTDLMLNVCSCSKDMCNRGTAVVDADLARLSALSKNENSLTDEEKKQLGTAVLGTNIEEWMRKQASLISVEQFYKSVEN